ncbi:MAG: hypothetical protein ACI4T9_03110 [Prevotella sp.]
MGTVSINNLWSFIQGLSLTASDRKWLAGKLLEPSNTDVTASDETTENVGGYIISPKRRKLMGSVNINPEDIESDERLKYILSK